LNQVKLIGGVAGDIGRVYSRKNTDLMRERHYFAVEARIFPQGMCRSTSNLCEKQATEDLIPFQSGEI